VSPLAYVVAAAVLVTAGGGFLYVAIRARRARAALVEATARLGASAQRLHENANRPPSDAELEALAERMYDECEPTITAKFFGSWRRRIPRWSDASGACHIYYRTVAAAAWKRGAR